VVVCDQACRGACQANGQQLGGAGYVKGAEGTGRRGNERSRVNALVGEGWGEAGPEWGLDRGFGRKTGGITGLAGTEEPRELQGGVDAAVT
jgi:hypothetical protein